MKKIYLYQLNRELKSFLTIFLLVLSIGVLFGLVFLFHTTSFDKDVTSERLIEAEQVLEEDFGINESKAKSTGELLMTTHNHILGFAFIFFLTGGIFYFNSLINIFWKTILITEPLISTVVSFGSLWLVRFYGNGWIYLTILSAILMYSAFFIMVVISIYDLNRKVSS
ncbi:MAG: hypothetical protein OQJ81_00625 [Melioribacteraceae bacterium]|nr:hypothetical protein [Melioribacteraceae bacterium]